MSRALLAFAMPALVRHHGRVNVPRTARERARAEVLAALLDAARRALATDGAAGLSLRAVARDLGMASSAVYRYVPSRDALLTMLIIEAYDAVGETAELADAAARASGHGAAERWLAVARAVRGWAREHQHQYSLVYGTPVPDYAAPQDTIASATRIWRVIAAIVRDAALEGSLAAPGPRIDAEGLLSPMVREVAGEESSAELREAAARAMALFTGLFGAISAELYGHFHGFTDDDARLFDTIQLTTAAGVGLTPAR